MTRHQFRLKHVQKVGYRDIHPDDSNAVLQRQPPTTAVTPAQATDIANSPH